MCVVACVMFVFCFVFLGNCIFQHTSLWVMLRFIFFCCFNIGGGQNNVHNFLGGRTSLGLCVGVRCVGVCMSKVVCVQRNLWVSLCRR